MNKKDLNFKSSLSRYIIAIPSYNRQDTIQTKTLAILKQHNINSKFINIFVANKEQYDKYNNSIPKKLYNKIIIGVLGLKNQRNFINEYYPEGTHIVEFDDDITKILQLDYNNTKSNTKSNIKSTSKKTKKNSKLDTKVDTKNTKTTKHIKVLKPIINLDKFIKYAFQLCQDKGIFLWGVYPIANAWFMNDTITTDLRFIVGPMWGMINRHKPELKLTIDEKENSERTLQHWKIDGGVLRFNNISIETLYYKNKGGMQNEGKNRKNEAMKSVQYLHKLYPNITKIYLGKKSGVPEIKLLKTST